MRGTSCSSRALFNVTHSTPVRQTQQQQHRQCYFLWWSRKNYSISRSSISPCCHILLVLLLLNIGICSGRRLVHKRPTTGNLGYSNELEYSVDRDNNVDYNVDVGAEGGDLSEIYIDEKDTNVKTIRFGDPKNPRTNIRTSKKAHNINHQRNQHSDDMQKLNIIGYEGDYYDNAKVLENNDVQKIGLSTQAMKNLFEQVADSILTEADKLYDTFGEGSLRGGILSLGESTAAALQMAKAKPESGNYVLCDVMSKN